MHDTVLAIFEQPRSQHTYNDTKVTVTENHAPTDDSIRIYQEMQNKAWESLTRAFTLETVFGKANIYEFKSHDWHGVSYAGQMDINGEVLNFKLRVSEVDRRREGPDYPEFILKMLVKEMSKAISEKMMSEAINTSELFKRKGSL